ncbi:hypothetical protein Ciccas_006627 [Cichlidogyrus casuarinus]|uniref:Uncharacterized protein n=1 Tax=Cichlidogyrus casuarinus TaxID=1844966 RepID=A0ABD2Q6A3_9PLAT
MIGLRKVKFRWQWLDVEISNDSDFNIQEQCGTGGSHKVGEIASKNAKNCALPRLKLGQQAFVAQSRNLNLFVRKLEPVKESQSDLLADHKTLYELQLHHVKPDHMNDYLQLLENFKSNVIKKDKYAQLAGAFTVEIGVQDVICKFKSV